MGDVKHPAKERVNKSNIVLQSYKVTEVKFLIKNLQTTLLITMTSLQMLCEMLKTRDDLKCKVSARNYMCNPAFVFNLGSFLFHGLATSYTERTKKLCLDLYGYVFAFTSWLPLG